MTYEEYIEDIKKLTDHNGGWFVIGSTLKLKIGDVLPYSSSGFEQSPPCKIIAEANMTDSFNDAAFIGRRIIRTMPFHYKVVMENEK